MDTLDPQDWPAGVVAGRVVLLRESGRPGMSELIDQVTPTRRRDRLHPLEARQQSVVLVGVAGLRVEAVPLV
jgi:hypothetical protein